MRPILKSRRDTPTATASLGGGAFFCSLDFLFAFRVSVATGGGVGPVGAVFSGSDVLVGVVRGGLAPCLGTGICGTVCVCVCVCVCVVTHKGGGVVTVVRSPNVWYYNYFVLRCPTH